MKLHLVTLAGLLIAGAANAQPQPELVQCPKSVLIDAANTIEKPGATRDTAVAVYMALVKCLQQSQPQPAPASVPAPEHP